MLNTQIYDLHHTMSNAHEYRLKNGQITEVNGHTNEHLDKYPDVKQHPDSNALSVGFIFDDGSELWETNFNGIKSLYTTPAINK